MGRGRRLSQHASAFYEYLRLSGKAEGTAYAYSRIVHRLLEFCGREPREVSREDVLAFLKHLREDRKCGDRFLSLAGWALRAYFEMLGRGELAKWIPIPAVYMQEEPEWLPEEEVLRIVEGNAVLAVAYDLALRVGEVPLLRRDRYNSDTGEIEVARLKHKGRPNKYMLVLRPWANELLKDWLRRNPRRDERIFPMTPRNVQYIWRKALVRAGYPPGRYTFHVLRHSRLTNIAIEELRTKGYVDIVSLAKFAGHLRPETTMRYVHLASKYLAFGSGMDRG